MQPLPPRIRSIPTRFADSEDGALSIEAAIMLPVLVFLYVAGFQYFESYRREAEIFKANYAVADLLSRRGDLITPSDLEGLQNVFEAIVAAAPNAAYMRFSEVRRTDDGVVVVWSYATDEQSALSTAALQGYLTQVPTLAPHERATIVESFVYDQPFFAVGLEDRIIGNFITVSQRYDARLAFAPGSGRGNDRSVIGNDTDCGPNAIPVGGAQVVGAGNCAGT